VQQDSLDDLQLALAQNPAAILAQYPDVAEHCLDMLRKDPLAFPTETLLQLAIWCETHNQQLSALHVYDTIAMRTTDPRSAEIALYRSAGLSWRQFGDGSAAIDKLEALLARFPRGTLVLDAEDLRDQISRSLPRTENVARDLAA